MLIICLDGYDPDFTKDIEWKNRFDIFKTIDTEDHTIASNCWVITGHGTSIRKFAWDSKEKGLFSHKDLGPPYLWELIETLNIRQAWISVPIISPLPKINNAVFIPGILSARLEEHSDEYCRILNKREFSEEDLKKLIDIDFNVYLKYKDYDFVFLYVFWLDPANHQHMTHKIKPLIDNWMNNIPLHNKTILYSDHGVPGVGKGYVAHKPKGILGLKGINRDISHIKELNRVILEELGWKQ